VRIATWNVNGLRARLPLLRHWLRARQPDLVALQELKLADEQFPHQELLELGYRAAVHGQKSWNGVAVLSREPARVAQVGLPGQEAQGARLLRVEVGGLGLTSLYCPNGKSVEHGDFAHKLAWLDALAGWAAKCAASGRPEVLGGDFNVCPGALDSWDEEGFAGQIFHTGAERDRLRALLAGGFADLFRERHPGERVFSWWDYRGGAFHRGQGLRIDLLLGTPPVLARVRAVEVDREYRKKQEGHTPSDHAPVYADLSDTDLDGSDLAP
jgi:exodeoxyribonuclease-3